LHAEQRLRDHGAVDRPENNGQTYNLRSIVAGIAFDTRDDVFNPRRGYNVSITDEFSSTAMGSSFNYTILTVDAARYFPVGKNQTLGIHVKEGTSTGAIPENKLFILDDQELRGYATPFYGTDMLLGQVEYRIPLSADRRFPGRHLCRDRRDPDPRPYVDRRGHHLRPEQLHIPQRRWCGFPIRRSATRAAHASLGLRRG
jgi:hypothetical protein